MTVSTLYQWGGEAAKRRQIVCVLNQLQWLIINMK